MRGGRVGRRGRFRSGVARLHAPVAGRWLDPDWPVPRRRPTARMPRHSNTRPPPAGASAGRMFTLQILDRGQTFLHTIEGRPLLLGSRAGADVMLREEGVEAAHARLEPKDGSVRLVALATTKVNGQPVEQVALALGDRIEIGRAVVIVGRTIARAAKPEDVLADTLPREPRRQPAEKKRRLLPLVGVLGAGLGLLAWLALGSSDASKVQGELATIRRARQEAQLERALASIDKLERQWADATDDRLQRLAVERDAIRAIEEA